MAHTSITHHAEPTEDDQHAHIVTPKTYVAVYITLLAATIATFGAAFIDLGELNPILAVGIACFKAVIVILFFMHVYFSSRLMKLTVAAGFFTFIVLIMMTLTDYISRSWGLW
jgi:cytochrome c oxidase subunit IV